MNDPLESRLHRLAPVALASVDECASMRTRKDRKYIVDAELLARAIDRIGEDMKVLEIGGIRWFTYRSVYFDTPDYDAYRLAAHRRPNRYKVRSRTYLDAGTTVLEVKTKDRAGQTVKHRLAHDGGAGDLDSAARAFASSVPESSAHAGNLVPVLTTSYLRATLLFPESEVRATIDSNYSVCDRDGNEVGFSAELIVETKTNGRPCALDRALWALGARPQTISKYCTGLAAIHPELPSNRWHRVLQRYFPTPRSAVEEAAEPPAVPRGERRHRPGRTTLVTAAVAVTAALVASGCASFNGAGESASSESGVEVNSEPVASDAVFDSSTVHSISVDLDDADYEAMIATYLSTEDKEWLEATVTIDGETYEQAGIRLKGNSSLRGLSGAGGGNGGEVSSDDPSTLPWLIKLDKYVDDQNHEGVNDFVVRSNTSESSLNEALALELLGQAGLATQDAIAVSFSVNDSDEQLRLVIEHPDDVWMAENFDAGDALYKAESTGDYSYRGDDPESYVDVFDQEAGKDNTDLTPLIEFLDFINNSDDATFEAELGEHLDVEAFATYLAMQDIVDNFDDIDGPGNNSYLLYDSDTGQFTVVPWDHNLAFGATNSGGGGGAGRGGPPGLDTDDATGAPVAPPGLDADDATGAPVAPPGLDTDDTDDAVGAVPPGPPGLAQGADGGPGNGGGPGGSNVLVERFLAVDEFSSLYEQQLTELTETLIDSGLAESILDEWATVLGDQADDLISEDALAAEVDQLRQAL